MTPGSYQKRTSCVLITVITPHGSLPVLLRVNIVQHVHIRRSQLPKTLRLPLVISIKLDYLLDQQISPFVIITLPSSLILVIGKHQNLILQH